MASEIRVNKLNSQTGVGTITLSPTGVDISGITTAETLKATTGIVTTLTATTGIVTTLTTNTLTANSTAKVGSGVTLSPDGDVFVTGVTTSSTVKVGGGVTITESGIEASGIGITCANINGTQIGGRRNIVINGGMSIAQRYGTTATTPTHETYVVDRWESHLSQTGKFSVQQVEDAPSGEGVGKYSSKITSLSAYTVTANDYFVYNQNIEGSNVDHLQFGTSSAKTITVSFYVKSSLTGTFAMAISNQAYNRRQAQEYTINSANTWERKSLTFTGDTTGTWLTTNGVGMRVHWSLGGGSNFYSASPGTWLATNDFTTSNAVNVVSTNAATWYITGVQVEVGTQATPFEYRTVAEELSSCQRYYYVHADARDHASAFQFMNIHGYSTSQVEGTVNFPVFMRTAPSVVQGSGTNYFNAVNASGGITFNSVLIYQASSRCCLLYQNANLSSNPSTGAAYRCQLSNANAYVHFSAEL